MGGEMSTEQLRAKLRETEDARVRAHQLHLLTAALSIAISTTFTLILEKAAV
jgi:hypothetical protein